MKNENEIKPLRDINGELMDELVQFRHDPFAYCVFAFPWGESGSALENYSGLDAWQKRIMKMLGVESDKEHPMAIAVATGQGVGKTATAAMAIKWFLDTHPNSRVLVTANTEAQLFTATMRELKKWNDLSITKHLWECSQERFISTDPQNRNKLFAVPCNKEKSERFVGCIDTTSLLVIFDEADCIPDKIWDVVNGQRAIYNLLWIAMGTPTNNTGRFYKVWNNRRYGWRKLRVDSRKAKMVDQEYPQRFIAEYGENSDVVRIHVKGLFAKKYGNNYNLALVEQEGGYISSDEMSSYSREGKLLSNIGMPKKQGEKS